MKNRSLIELKKLQARLAKTDEPTEKKKLLMSYHSVTEEITKKDVKSLFESLLFHAPSSQKIYAEIALLSIFAIGQGAIVFQSAYLNEEKNRFPTFIQTLIEVERFYESIGGIVGYHVTVLDFLDKKQKNTDEVYFPPNVIDLSLEGLKKAFIGLKALPYVGELYPIGGAGDRLSLKDESKPLPAALMTFIGKTLLDGLIGDVQAREYLYYKIYGKQLCTPIAMMTSLEKEGQKLIESHFKKNRWYLRPKETIYLFTQPRVPVITEKGDWSLSAPFTLNLKPGGHGAIWKTAQDAGVFEWLQKEKKKYLLLRQINNPLAAKDLGLLAFLGVGKEKNAAFGFAAASRLPQAKEGVLVLKEEKKGKVALVNIEYTDLQRIKNLSCPSLYPANTNILFANLKKIEKMIRKKPLPGLMINMKNETSYLTAEGKCEKINGGRLESMMQNISNFFVGENPKDLPTFVTYSDRSKLISTTKKQFVPSGSLLETPEGAFYDLMKCHYELLRNHCKFNLPSFSNEELYLEKGPSVIFCFLSALGPFFSVIAQKISKGKMAEGSELILDIAEMLVEELNLDGSLIIEAEQALGHIDEHGHLIYSADCGKCVLKNVTIKNRGIDRNASNSYWKGDVKRFESLKIVLKGNSELIAENICWEGNVVITVPAGERWYVFTNMDGEVEWKKEKISKNESLWNYEIRDGNLHIHPRSYAFFTKKAVPATAPMKIAENITTA